jgi:uncharacterized protein YqgC (DUF456 family)
MLASLGLVLGLLGALVPGFPGAAVALSGVAAYAALTGFEVVTEDALLLAALLALAGGFAQGLAPVWGLRLLSRASGAATGAAAGAALGLLSPLPLGAIVLGTLGSLVGIVVGRGGFASRVAALGGVVGAVTVAVVVDLLAVLGIGAVLGVSQFLAG